MISLKVLLSERIRTYLHIQANKKYQLLRRVIYIQRLFIKRFAGRSSGRNNPSKRKASDRKREIDSKSTTQLWAKARRFPTHIQRIKQ